MTCGSKRKLVSFVCPSCLTNFEFYEWEVESRFPKCDYCGRPLERVKNRR